MRVVPGVLKVGRWTGAVARVDWNYFTAAAIADYAIARRDNGTFVFNGICVRSNAFNLTQRPLVFVAPFNGGEWRWPVLELALVNGRVSGRLGPALT